MELAMEPPPHFGAKRFHFGADRALRPNKALFLRKDVYKALQKVDFGRLPLDFPDVAGQLRGLERQMPSEKFHAVLSAVPAQRLAREQNGLDAENAQPN